MARYWWVFLLRGLLAIAFGVIAFTYPGIALAVLVIFFGAYAFVDGAFITGATLANWRHMENHWLPMLQGILGVFVGVLTLRLPAVTALLIEAVPVDIGVLALPGRLLRCCASAWHFQGRKDFW